MKITICQLHDEPNRLKADWESLIRHVESNKSDLVLLPEMPFSRWFATSPEFDPGHWEKAVEHHEIRMEYLYKLAPATVAASRPVNRVDKRVNEGFLWSADDGYRPAHHKYFLPDETGFYEARWYGHGNPDFTVQSCGAAQAGFQICTELWSMEHARKYGEQQADLILNPRATEVATNEKWLVGGRAASIVSGSFCVSSNRTGPAENGLEFGGLGWITNPDGEVLATTNSEYPFITLDVDLDLAGKARNTYPRYAIR